MPEPPIIITTEGFAKADAEGRGAIEGVELVGPVQVNMLFTRMPAAAVPALDRGPFRYYKLGPEQRFVCRHDQEPAGMDALVGAVEVALA